MNASKTPLPKHQRGFSLIELITVIVLVGILAVYAASRFAGKDVFADHAAQDQIIAAARIAQQRAMYDHSATACYRLNISGNRLSAQSFDGATYNNIGPAEWQNGIVLEDVTVAAVSIYFDGMGNALGITANCAGSPTSTAISISGASNLQVCLFSSGHIQAQVQTDAC